MTGRPFRGALHEHLRKVLRRLIEVVERLSLVEHRFSEQARVAAAHITGAHVVETLEATAPAGKLQHVGRAVDVDARRLGAADGQVVDGGEVVDPRDGLRQPASAIQSQPSFGDVALDEQNALSEDRMPSREFVGARTCQHRIPALNEADGGGVCGIREHAREQLAREKAGEAGEEQGLHLGLRLTAYGLRLTACARNAADLCSLSCLVGFDLCRRFVFSYSRP